MVSRGRGLPLFAVALALLACFPMLEGTAAAEGESSSGTDSSEAGSTGVAGIVLLSAGPGCGLEDPRQAEVSFSWKIEDASLRTRPLRLEMTILERDFGPAPHSIHIPLDPGTEHYSYRGRLAQETYYYWRVSARGADSGSWVPSDHASFLAPTCASGDRVGPRAR